MVEMFGFLLQVVDVWVRFVFGVSGGFRLVRQSLGTADASNAVDMLDRYFLGLFFILLDGQLNIPRQIKRLKLFQAETLPLAEGFLLCLLHEINI